jgi:hypothetical protein
VEGEDSSSEIVDAAREAEAWAAAKAVAAVIELAVALLKSAAAATV